MSSTTQRRGRPSPQAPQLIALALIAAGALPAVGLAVLPGGLSLLGSPGTGIILVTALLFAPALAGFAVALQGFEAVRQRLRRQSADEHRQIVARVLLDALILAYVFGLVAAERQEAGTFSSLVVASLKLAAAWVFLLNVIIDPRPSAVRRHMALVADIALLSILLATGGPLTAPLAPVYIYHAISNGNRDGLRGMIEAAGLGVVSFAAIVAITPFWRQEPLIAAGTLAAMVLLPAYAGSLLHRLAGAKRRAEEANAAKSRALAALVHDLRGPLRAIARAGTEQNLTERGPRREGTIALIRSNARAMLLQLDSVLNYMKLDDGSLTPETRSFDVYQVANGAVAALQKLAAERGVTLTLHIDPMVPPELHGWPHQFRQLAISLMTDAIRSAVDATIRVNLSAAGFVQNLMTLRLAVAVVARGHPLEAADMTAGATAGEYPDLPLAGRLAELMEGRLTIGSDRHGSRLLAVELPFRVDGVAASAPPPLARTPVLIASVDAGFARELSGALAAWRAEPRWIGHGDNAFSYLEGMEPEGRLTVLIVDGRYELLPSLGWAHRAASLRTANRPLYMVFVADEARIDSVIGLADGELDSILAAPFELEALRGAFHALQIDPVDRLSAATDPALRGEPGGRGRAADAMLAAGPLTESEAGLSASAPNRPVTKERRRILIASNSPANRRIIRSILGQAGHAVRLADTVGDARQGLESRAIDVLLLDLTGMPGADYEAARLCRHARPGLTIIALSKDDEAEAQRRAHEIGLDAVVPKPVEPQQLLACIEAAIDAAPAPARGARPLPFQVVGNPASPSRFAGEASSAVND